MALHVHSEPYGPPALDRLAALVGEAQGADRLAPVTVVVPTNYVGVATRRALARRDGLAGVSFLTVYRLAELLGAARLAGAGRRPVSTPVVAGAVRQALRQVPGCFEAVREHPATEEALVAAHRELRDAGEAAVAAVAQASRRAADVARIHQHVTGQLADRWYDEADLLAAATAAVREGRIAVAALGTVVVHLPQRLPVAAGALLAALAERGPVHVVAGRTGHLGADRGVAASVARIGGTARGRARSARTPPRRGARGHHRRRRRRGPRRAPPCPRRRPRRGRPRAHRHLLRHARSLRPAVRRAAGRSRAVDRAPRPPP